MVSFQYSVHGHEKKVYAHLFLQSFRAKVRHGLHWIALDCTGLLGAVRCAGAIEVTMSLFEARNIH